MLFKRARRWLAAISASAFLVTSLTLPASADGDPAAPQHQPVDLDLTSTTASLAAPHFVQDNPVDIMVGDAVRSVTSSSVLTPAERLAAYQVFSTGQQSIIIGAAGNAVGGTFTMGPQFSNYVSSLVIPAGVTAVKDFGLASTLNLAGNLTNAGNFYAMSTNPAVDTATIMAANIINQQNALLTSILPGAGLPGFNNVASALNLNLVAVTDIINQGTIASAANLSMSAGNALTNQNIISAVQNVNIFTGLASLINTGIISSALGNINIAGMLGQNLVVNNAGGSMQALLGNINVSNVASLIASNLSLTGGDILSRELNIEANGGKAFLSVNELAGVLNMDAGVLDVTANTDTLKIGDVHVTGDPQFFNPTGDVQITGNLLFNPFTPPGYNNLEIAASGNIYTAGGNWQISTGNTGNANSGNILMVAGVNMTPSSGGTGGNTSGSADQSTSLTFSGVSATGGYIDLTGGGQFPITQLDTSCNGCSGGSGGSITLVAYYNSASPGSATALSSGTVLVPPTVAITTFTSANVSTAQNGDVIVMAGAPSNPQTSNALNPSSDVILLGDINTSGNTISPVINNGRVNIIAGNPSYLIAPNNNTTPNTQNLIDGGAQAGQTFIPVTDFTGISAGQSLVINPGGANAETVQVSSGYTTGYSVTLANPVVFNHGSQEYVLTPSSTLTTAQGGGNPAGSVIPQNGGAFYVGSSTATGSINVGAINAGANVVISTAGTVNLAGSVSLTQNPIPAQNYNNTPVLQITGQQVITASGTTVSSSIANCSPCFDVLNIYTPNLTNNATISGSYVNIQSTASGAAMTLMNSGTISGVNPNAMVNIQSAGNLVLNGSGATISVPALSVIAISVADTNSIQFESNYSLNGGSNGLVAVSAEGEGAFVSLARDVNLTVGGGPILSISTPRLALSGGAVPTGILATGASNFIFTSGALTQSPQPLTIALVGRPVAISTSGTSIILRPTDGQNIVFQGAGTLNFSGAPVYFFTGTANGVAGSIQKGPSVTLTSVMSTYQAVNPNGGITGIAFQPYVGGVTSGTSYTLFSTYSLAQVMLLMAQVAQTGLFQSLSTYSQGSALAQNGLDPTVASNYVINGAAMHTIQAAKLLGLQVTAGAYVQLSNSKAIQVAGTEVEISYAIQQAKTYGNVMDLVVGNECIVDPRDATTTSLIQAINFAQTQRNAEGFTAQTLPVTTRQTYGVLSGASTYQSTVDLLNGCTGCGSTYNLPGSNFAGVDGHVYADVYPYYDAPIINYLNPNAQFPFPPPSTGISQANFQTLVTNNGTPTQLPAPAPNATGIQQDLNGTLKAFAGQVGPLNVAITPQLWVAETGWATGSTPASDAPVASTQFATWYYPDMQAWSMNNRTIADPAPSYTIPIKGYFEAFNEPWKTVANDTTGQGGEPHFGVWEAAGNNIIQAGISPGFVLTGISQKYSLPVFNQQPGPVQASGLPSPIAPVPVETNTSSNSVLTAIAANVVTSLSEVNSQSSSQGSTSIISIDQTPGITSRDEMAVVNQIDREDLFLTSLTLNDNMPSPSNNWQSDGGNSFYSDQFNSAIGPSNGQPGLTQVQSRGAVDFCQLSRGAAFFTPSKTLQVQTQEGVVQVNDGAQAFVIETGNDVCVYNLHDTKHGGVKVVVGNKSVRVPLGKQLVLTRKPDAGFDEINPGMTIANRNPQKLEFGDGVSGYMADFSIMSAVANIAPVRKMLTSKQPETQKLGQQIIKNAAIMATISTAGGPYRTSKQ